MPELPEVESVRRRLEPELTGRVFEQVEISDPRLTRPFDREEVARELAGERVEAIGRRGKYLIVRFESGRALLVHLRMTGSLRHGPAGSLPDDPHRRAQIRLDDGSDLAYRDVRRFGTWLLLEPASSSPTSPSGSAPSRSTVDSGRASSAERLAGRRAPLKAALLDQRTLAGVGNIYADEALWRARLHPLREAGSLDAGRAARPPDGDPDRARARDRTSGLDAPRLRAP